MYLPLFVTKCVLIDVFDKMRGKIKLKHYNYILYTIYTRRFLTLCVSPEPMKNRTYW